jgi:hypothetical protein
VVFGPGPLATVCRNFGLFPFAWVEGHAGTGRVRTSVDARRDHRPPEPARGTAFCWAAVHPSPDGTRLAVEGCVWACPYELVLYDFSDPMSPDPPRVLKNLGE